MLCFIASRSIDRFLRVLSVAWGRVLFNKFVPTIDRHRNIEPPRVGDIAGANRCCYRDNCTWCFVGASNRQTPTRVHYVYCIPGTRYYIVYSPKVTDTTFPSSYSTILFTEAWAQPQPIQYPNWRCISVENSGAYTVLVDTSTMIRRRRRHTGCPLLRAMPPCGKAIYVQHIQLTALIPGMLQVGQRYTLYQRSMTYAGQQSMLYIGQRCPRYQGDMWQTQLQKNNSARC